MLAIRLALTTLVVLISLSDTAQGQLAIKGKTVYTMAGDPIQDGVILVRDGKIEEVGPASEVIIPTGIRVIAAEVVTPGLIDAHTTVGISGYFNQSHDQDQLDRTSPMQPELRALDAYNAREKLVEWVRSFGVTTLHTGHAPGAVISGQTMIVKTTGGGADKDVVRRTAMIACTLGDLARGRDGKSPGTRAKIVALLRQELIKAAEYRSKQEKPPEDDSKQPPRDLGLESLIPVLEGRVPLLITAHRVHDLMAALRLKKEFGISIVLDGAAECHQIFSEIAEAKVPIILHPPMARARGELENLSMETPARAQAAGIQFALQSGYESYVPKTRVLLFEGAIAAAHGLSFQDTLAALTIEAAKILGIEDRVGSLEKGKDADIAMYDGDPFEYTSHCISVLIDGVVVSEGAR